MNVCQCHVLDPHKLKMLLWKNSEAEYILKIAEQKFVGEIRTDRRGEVYWRFRDLYEEKLAEPIKPVQAETKPSLEIEVNKPLSNLPSITNQVAKFQERQAKSQRLQAEIKGIPSAELERLAREKEQQKAS